LVGFKPGSIVVTDVQGSSSSLTVLINPYATLAGDFSGNGVVGAPDYVLWRKGLGTTYTEADYDLFRSQFGETPSSGGAGAAVHNTSAVPEPSILVSCLVAAFACFVTRRVRCAFAT